LTRDVLTTEGRFDWGRYDFGTFRRRDVFTMGRCDCDFPDFKKLHKLRNLDLYI